MKTSWSEIFFLKINKRGVLISSRGGRKSFEKLINVPPSISYLRVLVTPSTTLSILVISWLDLYTPFQTPLSDLEISWTVSILLVQYLSKWAYVSKFIIYILRFYLISKMGGIASYKSLTMWFFHDNWFVEWHLSFA